MRKKTSFRERFRYWFDRLMGKGTITLVAVLFLVTALVVFITGLLGGLCNGELSTGNSIWQSLMHALDAGTLAGDDTGNLAFVILMSIVTVCGIFVTSILIGIISSGFEEKLNSLRKGFSKVIEENHTVIIGFNEGIYTILSELIEANANQKRGCIVIIGAEDKEVMDEEIRNHVTDCKTTEIICRSGNCNNARILEMASIETARSIILNQGEDFQTIKALLATNAYLKEKNCLDMGIHIVSLIQEEGNLEAARIAGEGRADVIFLTDILARIIAHTCRQPGMSLVLTDLFDYGGAEFYFENFPQLAGHTFGEILNWFKDSTVVGYARGGVPHLNPPMDQILEAEDEIIHLAEDDGISVPVKATAELQLQYQQSKMVHTEPYQLLVLGYNESILTILGELDQYVVKGSGVILAGETIPEELSIQSRLQNITCDVESVNIYNKAVLEQLINAETQNVLILNEEGCEPDDADAHTMLLLLQLRDIAARRQYHFNIVSEMNSVENQKLSKVARVNDFVVGSTIANLILTQISENRELLPLFEDLLDADGSEIYMKSASNYIKCGETVNMYTLTEIAAKRHEIVIGCKLMEQDTISIMLNPSKDTQVCFQTNDMLIVIAED